MCQLGVVNPGAMKIPFPVSDGRQYSSPSDRAQLLAAFNRSGLSAAAFARQHKLKYSTFCAWRQRTGSKVPIAFTEVELPLASAPPAELIIELGAHARVRIRSEGQLPLLGSLLHQLNTAR
jgi:hypothetical protein